MFFLDERCLGVLSVREVQCFGLGSWVVMGLVQVIFLVFVLGVKSLGFKFQVDYLDYRVEFWFKRFEGLVLFKVR